MNLHTCHNSESFHGLFTASPCSRPDPHLCGSPSMVSEFCQTCHRLPTCEHRMFLSTTSNSPLPFPLVVHVWVSHSAASGSLWPHGLPTEFSRQEYWGGLPFPSPGYLPNPGIEPCTAGRFLTVWATISDSSINIFFSKYCFSGSNTCIPML